MLAAWSSSDVRVGTRHALHGLASTHHDGQLPLSCDSPLPGKCPCLAAHQPRKGLEEDEDFHSSSTVHWASSSGCSVWPHVFVQCVNFFQGWRFFSGYTSLVRHSRSARSLTSLFVSTTSVYILWADRKVTRKIFAEVSSSVSVDDHLSATLSRPRRKPRLCSFPLCQVTPAKRSVPSHHLPLAMAQGVGRSRGVFEYLGRTEPYGATLPCTVGFTEGVHKFDWTCEGALGVFDIEVNGSDGGVTGWRSRRGSVYFLSQSLGCCVRQGVR